MKRLILIATVAATVLLANAQDTFKVNVETMQVYTAVTDLKGRFVTGLKPDSFKVFEDGKEQKIDAFTSDDSPVSVGIVFDVNGATGDNFLLAKQGALAFLKAGNLRDEYFVVEYNDHPQLTEDYTRDLSTLEKHAQVLRPSKQTAVVDAVQLSLEKLRAAQYPRKVLLVFASGGMMKNENKASDVRDLARKQDVEVLGVTIIATDNNPGFGPHEGTQLELGLDHESGLDAIDAIGGDGFASDSAPDFLNVCRRIAVGVRNQYILGYASTNPVHDGKYRHIQVKLTVKEVPDLIVHARAGYYAMGPEGVIQ